MNEIVINKQKDVTKNSMKAILLFTLVLLLGCHNGSNVRYDFSSMSDAEKLSLLQKKYLEWRYEGRFVDGEVDSLCQIIAETEKKFYCYDNQNFVWCYSIDNDSWEILQPPETVIRVYHTIGTSGCEEYLLVGDRLYLKIPAKVCEKNVADYLIYDYDIKKDVWELVPIDEDVTDGNGHLCIKPDKLKE